MTSTPISPGFTIVQGGFGCTWQLTGDLGNSSGWSLEYRGGTVWAGNDWYPTAVNVPPPGPRVNPPWGGYNFTCNTIHELGHVMYRLHAKGNDPQRSEGGGATTSGHDSIVTPLNGSVCVMSYKTCEGQFCAKCLFAFRGWDITKIP